MGETYLDSIDGKGTVFTDGNYELLLQLNKNFSEDSETRFDAFIGAKYKGSFNGEPNSGRGRGASGCASKGCENCRKSHFHSSNIWG
jgi:hypothetical protein